MKTEITTDPEFASLIPPLTPQELAGLEENLLAEGCLSPLVAWKGQNILIDGHNRKTICEKHGIDYDVHFLSFENRDTVKRWIIEHQFGRRNLSSYQRSELSLQLKPLLAAEAKERQRNAGGDRRSENAEKPVIPNLGQPKTDDVLAEIAGISKGTLHKADYINQHADEETKERLRRGETSIHAEYTKLRKSNQKESKTPPAKRPFKPKGGTFAPVREDSENQTRTFELPCNPKLAARKIVLQIGIGFGGKLGKELLDYVS